MRIIAGDRKGFPIRSPRGQATRPTLGRVRESLFSILCSCIPEARVADLYAGSGALGLEALSRGACSCVFVEKSPAAIDALKQNLENMRFNSEGLAVRLDVLKWLKNSADVFDLVLLDPPYDTGAAMASLVQLDAHLALSPGATVVMQCGSREVVPAELPRLRKYRSEKYGDTALHFYELRGQ